MSQAEQVGDGQLLEGLLARGAAASALKPILAQVAPLLSGAAGAGGADGGAADAAATIAALTQLAQQGGPAAQPVQAGASSTPDGVVAACLLCRDTDLSEPGAHAVRASLSCTRAETAWHWTPSKGF
jgi:hypothetical protein